MNQVAAIISGTDIASKITQTLATVILDYSSQEKRAPCFAVVVVGERKDSAAYVSMKRKKAEQIGINCRVISYAAEATQSEIENAVQILNLDDAVDGIIVQLPLPKQIDEGKVTGLVSPHKDIDGFHPANIGNLITVVGDEEKRPYFVACTARGIIRMIRHTGIPLKGALVVLVGTGTVGKPLAMLLIRENATVVCCNKNTKDIQSLTRQADVVIAACGSPGLVKGSWVKPGAVLIDVGINSIPDVTRKSGRRLVGDVDYKEVSKALGPSGWISPVPGGVGPMTVAMIMTAVVEAWKRNVK